MSKRNSSRLGLGEVRLSPANVFVAEHGDGLFTIHLGGLKIETSVEAWHELSEAVWEKYFGAIQHKKYLDSLLPDRATVKRNRGPVVA